MRGILMYHSIDGSGSPISLEPGAFRQHVRWLCSGRVRVVPLEHLAALSGEDAAVALTFDDAFVNFATQAWPLLRDHGLPVTLFVPTRHVGGTNAWDPMGRAIPRLPLLNWDTLAHLAIEGVALGAHTQTHPALRRVPQSRLEDEVCGASERLYAGTGCRPTSFAYPFGEWDGRVLALVRSSFSAACTTEFRLLVKGEDPHLLPRLDAFYFRDPRRLAAWGSARFRRGVWLRDRARRARQSIPALGRSS